MFSIHKPTASAYSLWLLSLFAVPACLPYLDYFSVPVTLPPAPSPCMVEGEAGISETSKSYTTSTATFLRKHRALQGGLKIPVLTSSKKEIHFVNEFVKA